VTPQQILKGVREVIREHLKVSSLVTNETHLLRDLQLDSLKQLTLVVELENHFRVRFDSGDEEGLETVGDIVRLIGRRLSESHQSV